MGSHIIWYVNEKYEKGKWKSSCSYCQIQGIGLNHRYYLQKMDSYICHSKEHGKGQSNKGYFWQGERLIPAVELDVNSDKSVNAAINKIKDEANRI